MADSGKVILELSHEQAEVLERAAELLFRLHIGQFDEIRWTLLTRSLEHMSRNGDCIRNHLEALREIIFPELRRGESFNIDCCKDSHIAYNIYQAIRYVNAWHRNPNGGVGVNFDPPLPNGLPIPKCYIKNGGNAHENDG